MATSRTPSASLIVSFTCQFVSLAELLTLSLLLTLYCVGQDDNCVRRLQRRGTREVRRSKTLAPRRRRVRQSRGRFQDGAPRRVRLDERYASLSLSLSCLVSSRPDLMQIASAAAYQVGLSFLTNHMRRAVAACTSPEVFFGRTMMGEHTAAPPSSIANDPLGLAMESLTLSPSISGLRSATPPPSYSLP